MWGFNETAKGPADRGTPDHERYAAWVEMYAGEEFTDLTKWCKDLMDEVAVDANDAERGRYRDLFATSAQYEYLFWDAAWEREEWPL